MKTITALTLATLLGVPAAEAARKAECFKQVSTTSPKRRKAMAGLRPAAQKGLEYLVGSSKAWTAQHKCYGCHVQAVTLEGLTVGHHNQYDVGDRDIKAMVDALKLGVTAGGRRTGAAFQGAAWARYDQWIDDAHTDDLLKYARELIRYQNEAGAVEDDDRRPPVVAGTMQTTFQAMQTWRQAYARTADEAWLSPMRRAEGYLAKTARSWKKNQEISILDVNYALMGLVAAGVKSSEPTSKKLQKNLLARQNKDGGFGLTRKKSDALATGQTLYALKLAGYGDREAPIARGMRYLIANQAKDGSWKTVTSRQNGADKGEAMWAVLGLVSVDVMSIDIAGLREGQRVDGSVLVDARASDNSGNRIAQMELFLDDAPLAARCGDRFEKRVSTADLEDGRHVLDVVATNGEGKTSMRRVEFYTGDIFMTHVGTRFDNGRQRTEISLRNIAPDASQAGTIRLEVTTDGKKPKRVFKKDFKGEVGAMMIPWDGKKRGRYVAHVSFIDREGNARQKETVMFFHDSAKVQQARFGEIEGNLSASKGGSGVASNTVVELVDKDGRVVQRTRTTEQGNYRFKNVDKGKYKLRVRKRGFRDEEAAVEAAPASAPAKVDLSLQ